MDSDEWETPKELYESLCYKYGIFPTVDICADEKNKKCNLWKEDSLEIPWGLYSFEDGFGVVADIWCNPPHSKTEDFVRKACKEWIKHNINIMMIIPANSICTKYGEECIEPHAEYHPIFFRPKFLRYGELKDPSRNSYFVVIWRKRNA